MAFTVSQVARMTKLSVRALRHYDEIGLLHPTGRSEAGYRLYEQRDLQRLQQILVYRELGFPLEGIRRIVSDSKYDLREALRRQRDLLAQKARRFQTLLQSVDAAIDSLEKGTSMDPQMMFEGFDSSKYEAAILERGPRRSYFLGIHGFQQTQGRALVPRVGPREPRCGGDRRG